MTAKRTIVIASPEGESGKSTIALGVIDLLVRQGQRVGVFRPVSRVSSAEAAHDDGTGRDHVLEMLLEHDGVDLTYEESVGITYDDVHADVDSAMSRIVARYHDVAARCDSVVVLGTDYTDVSGPTELAFNAKIAANLGAPVLLVVSGRGRSDEDTKALTQIGLGELRANHATPIGVMINRYDGTTPPDVAALTADPELPVWVVPEEPFLHAPTVRQLMESVGGELWLGDSELLSREALDVIVGAMSVGHLLDHLSDGCVVITPGDRSDVILSLLAAQSAVSFPSMAGIILTGGMTPEGTIGELVTALAPHVPLIRTAQDTFPAARTAGATVGRVSADATRKVDVARGLFESAVDSEDLLARLAVPSPSVVTPLMFEYELIERARADRRRVVLPEGDDDRVLRAASTVLARGIADLTILGDETSVRARATELGLDISAATVLSPTDPVHVEKYAAEYTRLRAHKGMTVERAREIVTDVSYFGTMMVHVGDAHGMVSGAAHTTAHTIRPSFEIIKTAPGISSVSGVFLMCLEDRVLVYGDCAVIPDPTTEQLADVAIASAATAAQFGVEPRIAMLSYSTGESGSGADVDKVRAATAIVKERRPDLSVEGPIQYDAAVDAAVAASKLPGSDVAGRATVFVFPDLNTGNNTYKAVQRSAGAVAVGPVLQGLNKPVNDLSRGALVQDIINTVAITAIQAQGATE
ncbi:phosphate acetyltransferase [Xylanimonas cellulosilytica DSM 15894]|uniref:Phosphate acetyltransferase n=1 Tax=Xylanimonas cellulosilytica (strain DSM 15894 / JCM 12276 / CECT 5975 / KCTC 9989 / LMG 20990 / NBRC 107835 / XIL07) TaxID=446471 RepID=D1BXC2_XYLCX|nr:phosphate acetyltransferase [Xylanimonas cellulosilytica]ACZ29732.1 phosphate acetyltransferase [Xylanimonas cellulosilytica DSM 15894]